MREDVFNQGLDVAVTSAEDLEEEEALGRREALGFSPFESKDIALRLSPKALLPSAKSILVFCLNYYSENHPLPEGCGRLARISRGRDYHLILGEEISRYAKEKNLNGRVLVDSHPLLERALAARAGLGFLGRNTQLIHPHFGSYVALGLFLSEEELPETKRKLRDGCGDCHRCWEACPGKALGPWGLNPARCLSQITQEKRPRTEEEGKILGRRLYGCDVCQEVCPKNTVAKSCSQTLHGELTEFVNLEELLTLSNRQFKERFGHLAGAWRGKRPWVENALAMEVRDGHRGHGSGTEDSREFFLKG